MELSETVHCRLGEIENVVLCCLLVVLPFSGCAVLCGAILAAIVYATVQDGRRTDVQGDWVVTRTRLDALLRSCAVRHHRCQSMCVVG